MICNVENKYQHITNTQVIFVPTVRRPKMKLNLRSISIAQVAPEASTKIKILVNQSTHCLLIQHEYSLLLWLFAFIIIIMSLEGSLHAEAEQSASFIIRGSTCHLKNDHCCFIAAEQMINKTAHWVIKKTRKVFCSLTLTLKCCWWCKKLASSAPNA